MVAMQALRRDVLQWLVSLNLSFPIKNIKRDFSNGFLVAEILSRYYPQHVKMHSFDYGTRLAKKRDNWEQLKKIFWKEDFPFFPDEIDNIINCGPHDGAGPLLERLYGFLTHKRYKPEDTDVDELWLGIPDTNLLLTNGMPTLSKEDYNFLSTADKEACYLTESAMKSPVQNFELTARIGGHMDEEATLVEAKSQEDLLDSGFHETLESSQLQGDNFSLQRESEDGQSVTVNNLANAVERAREKDRKLKYKGDRKGRSKACVCEAPSDHNQRDTCLAFRSPNRQRHFKSYTLTDYRKQQTGRYIVLGKLGPETTDSLLSQRVKLEKMKAFGRNARDINVSQTVESRKPKEKRQSCRAKAMEFASKIPKPKIKVLQKENLQVIAHHSSQPMTELQKLEAKHQQDRQQVEAIRRDLEFFIR